MEKDPRYPIGKFKAPEHYSSTLIQDYIQTIESLPDQLKKEVDGLSPEQLDTPYREGGWTVRQVVHHLADSHMNAFIRFKLALSEDQPQIKPYAEGLWAQMPDYTLPPEASLQILTGLHERLALLWKNMSAADLEKTYVHPEYKKVYALKEVMALYAWHGRHHLAHITELKKQKNWA
ncbi:MAG TPA: putative metal-dependent hydrolase [Bacteroidia bacterium]|nr:putative metal-dependent hydrolase [Bacteroidia bacterium]